MKTCTRCGVSKDLAEFRITKAGTRNPYHVSQCRGCESEYRCERWHNRPAVDMPVKPPLPTREELVAWYEAGCPLSGVA